MTKPTSFRTCGSCGQTLPATEEFYRQKRGRPQCNICRDAEDLKYKGLTPEEKKRAKCRESDRKHKDTKRAYIAMRKAKDVISFRAIRARSRKKWRAAHPGYSTGYNRKWYAENKEKAKETVKKWQKANPQKVYAARLRRLLRLLTSEGSGTPFDEQAQLFSQCGRCAYCGAPLEKYHVDHVIPLSRGGSDLAANKVLACPSCNTSKGDQLPGEWKREEVQ